jgi:hypothetical protein
LNERHHTKSRLETFLIAACIAIFLAALVLGSLTSRVGAGEIMVKECGGERTVWRSPADKGFHWIGLCVTRTFHAIMYRSFSVQAKREGVNYFIRGVATVRAPEGDADLLALSGRFPSEEALFNRSVLARVMETTRRLAEDPIWLKTRRGGWVQNQFKDGLEYGLKRLSPTGHIWSSHESRHELQNEINIALQTGVSEDHLPITVELGLIIER